MRCPVVDRTFRPETHVQEVLATAQRSYAKVDRVGAFGKFDCSVLFDLCPTFSVVHCYSQFHITLSFSGHNLQRRRVKGFDRDDRFSP